MRNGGALMVCNGTLLAMRRLIHVFLVLFLLVLGSSCGPPLPRPTTAEYSFATLDGSAIIVAADGQFLGSISSNEYGADSIMNPYGTYGNKYSATSIFNDYGRYGGKYSSYSPFNAYTHTPPQIYIGSQFIAYLTVNQFLSPRVSPYSLIAYLQSQ